MIDFILEYRWIFFILGEIVFWVSIVSFLLLRYGFGLEKLSKYVIIIWLLSDLWLLTLGVMDYVKTGVIDSFQIIIVVVLAYALTSGKSDLQKLDNLIKRKLAKRKGQPLSTEENDLHNKTLGRFEHAKKEARRLAVHITIYLVVMGILIILYGLKPLDLSLANNIIDKFTYLIGNGFINHEFASNISGLWTLVIFVNTLYTLSHFIFPKKNKHI